MRKVLLAGAFGQGNPGDEALLDSFLEALPGWHAVVTSRDPAATEVAHCCEAVPTRDARSLARRVVDSDAVVFAGGTLFKLLDPSTRRHPLDLLRKALALALWARTLGKPVAMVGVGAGTLPSRTARALARSLVRQADLLILRDRESAEILADAGAPTPFRVGADPAWTLMEPLPPASPRGDPVVVAFSHHAGGAELAPHLAEALAPVASSGLRVLLQPWQAHAGGPGDLDLARAVAARMGGHGEIVPPPDDLVAARHLFASARAVVGLRFHSLIAAASAGAPFVALAHEPKLLGLARRLSQPAVLPLAPPWTIAERVLHASDAPPPARDTVRSEAAAAEEGFRLLRLLLDAGSSEEADRIVGLPLEPVPWRP